MWMPEKREERKGLLSPELALKLHDARGPLNHLLRVKQLSRSHGVVVNGWAERVALGGRERRGGAVPLHPLPLYKPRLSIGKEAA